MGDLTRLSCNETNNMNTINIDHFERLPIELVAQIATHMDEDRVATTWYEVEHNETITSKHKATCVQLHSLRLVCKQTFDGCQREFIDRHIKTITVYLDPQHVRRLVRIFTERPILGAKVTTLILMDPRENYPHRPPLSHGASTFSPLLQRLLELLPTVSYVRVRDIDHTAKGRDKSPASSLALEALAQKMPASITRLQLFNGAYSRRLLQRVFRAGAHSVESLVMDVRLDKGRWDSVVARIRDDMKALCHLEVGVVAANENALKLFNRLGESIPIEHRGFRSKSTGKIEHYSHSHGHITGSGAGAVKLSINRALERCGSKWFDPTMTKESLGF